MSKEEGITLKLGGELAVQFAKMLALEVAKQTEFTPPEGPLMVSAKEGAEMIGVKDPDTFKAEAGRQGFRKKQIGRYVRYNKADVIAYIESRD